MKRGHGPTGPARRLDLLAPARMSLRDLAAVGGAGLRARPMRVALSGLGIAIGIAAMIAVVGISASSRAQLDRQLDALGTNLLTVGPGTSMFGESATMPSEAPAMIARIGPVQQVAATGKVGAAHAYRHDRIPAGQTGGISVLASELDLLETLGGQVSTGSWLNAATAQYPTAVLGATTARLLGVGSASPDVRIWVAGRWFTVVGVLDQVALAPEVDNAVLIGWPAAEKVLGTEVPPTRVYTRQPDSAVASVRAVLAATANPSAPNEVEVSRPSDALAARQASDRAFTGLLLGLGGVALLVGGVGVANTMVISVLERRGEIGLRRSLGATRRQVRAQFLVEAVLLSLLGGAAGVVLGIGVTAVFGATQGWPAVVPAWASAGAVAVTIVIGALSGLYPAVRAARLSPTEALATT